MKRTRIVDISDLTPHERTSPIRVLCLAIKMLILGTFTTPILIDIHTKTILDGHHRFWAAKILGFKKIPCYCVNYLRDKSISVHTRRPKIKVNKKTVIDTALNGRIFPYKTSRHKYTAPDFEPLPIYTLSSSV